MIGVGGLEWVLGVGLGAVVLALVETFGPYVPIPWYWHGWFFYHFSESLQPAVSFGLLVVVLLIIPQGLACLFAKKRRLAGHPPHRLPVAFPPPPTQTARPWGPDSKLLFP